MSEHFHAVMDRNIFKLKELSMEATSAYIIIASVVGENAAPSLDIIRARWNASEEKLDLALKELSDRNVIVYRSGPAGEPLYYPKPSSFWR